MAVAQLFQQAWQGLWRRHLQRGQSETEDLQVTKHLTRLPQSLTLPNLGL